MKSYSQNREDIFILNYFNGKTGTLLSIGENDGITFSNAKLLIEHGFSAHLIEPGSINTNLTQLHRENHRVEVHTIAIGKENGRAILHESAEHIPNGSDWGLVSSLIPEETERWRKSGVGFVDNEVDVWDFATFYNYVGQPVFDFISIDCEGLDWDVLQQIDLTAVGCKCLVVEWNSIQALKAQFTDYCGIYGLKLAHINAENLIFTKNK